eukprot:2399570-Karenia_brevis.AAC.1
MMFVTQCPKFVKKCDEECRVVYFCEPGQPFDVSSQYVPDWRAYTTQDIEQGSGFTFKRFTNASTTMQQRARHFRNYVDFATAARYIVEDVASGELRWKVSQQHHRLAVCERKWAAQQQAEGGAGDA